MLHNIIYDGNVPHLSLEGATTTVNPKIKFHLGKEHHKQSKIAVQTHGLKYISSTLYIYFYSS